jgi:hypothetical protein
MGKNIKREAVLINPGIMVGDTASQSGSVQEGTSNVIATGATTQEILSKLHGR